MEPVSIEPEAAGGLEMAVGSDVEVDRAVLLGHGHGGQPGVEGDAPISETAPLSKRGRDYRTRRALVLADLCALLIGIGALGLTDISTAWLHALWALPTIPVWLLLFVLYGLYSSGLRRVGHSTVDDIPRLAHALLLGSVALWGYFQITPAGKLRFGPLCAFAAIVLCADVLLRWLARRLSRRMLGNERVLFVGSGPMTPVLVRQIMRRPRHGIELVGALTRAENEHWPLPIASLGAVGGVDTAALLRRERVDRVVVSAEGMEDDLLLELVDRCRTMAIKVSALPSLAAMIGPAATIDQLEGVTVIGLNLPSLPRSSQVLKRAMDIVGAAVLLALSAPLWVAVAIAIKLDSPGPVLFRQERIGRAGKPFRLAKFRSMGIDAEARREELLAQSRQAAWLDLEHDPRVTRVGRVLRLASLDEIPQLWSVLRGHMSLVGPRPLVAQEDVNVSGWARGRLDLTPGLTGMWQVLGRTHIPFEQMVMLDYLYVANWSLWTDVKLLLRTLPSVLSRSGAN
jgi:exopolysaccharide biosynthesis polyprenyl glycosylphosphotransferase